MDNKTIKMFVSTCNYLEFIADEIVESNLELPFDMTGVLHSVMCKLYGLMNNVALKNKSTMDLIGSAIKNHLANNAVNPNVSTFTQGIPVVNYGVPSTTRVSNVTHSIKKTKSNTNIPSKANDSLKKADKRPDGHVSASQPVKTAIPANPTSQNTNEGIYINNILITKLFCDYTKSIANNVVTSENIGVYCRLCDSVCIGSWANHANQETHVKENANFKTVKMYSCYICKLTLYGTCKTILRYFQFHFDKIHFGKTDMPWEKALVEVDYNSVSLPTTEKPKKRNKNKKALETAMYNKATSVNIPKSSVSSGIGSSKNTGNSDNSPSKSINKAQIANSNPPNRVTNSKQNTKSNSGKKKKEFGKSDGILKGPLNTQAKAPTQTNVPLNTPVALSINSSTALSHPTPQNSFYEKYRFTPSPRPLFDFMLIQVVDEWIKSGIDLYAGFCSICQVSIMSSFDWLSHVENHIDSDPSNKYSEKMCEHCNIKVYGENNDVYFRFPIHLEFDKMLKRK